MKFVSVDIETCGLDPNEHSIVQVGAVIEDTELKLDFDTIPKFEMLLEYPYYKGTPFALAMHTELFKELAKSPEKRIKQCCPHWQLAELFAKWLIENKMAFRGELQAIPPVRINVAGKNFATFDKLFLENLPNWEKFIKISQRIIDPAVLFWNPATDETLPDLSECKRRAGLTNTNIAHTGPEDAYDVIEILRTKY